MYKVMIQVAEEATELAGAKKWFLNVCLNWSLFLQKIAELYKNSLTSNAFKTKLKNDLGPKLFYSVGDFSG